MSDLISKRAVLAKINLWANGGCDTDKLIESIKKMSGGSLTDRLDDIRAEIAELDDADYDYEGYYKAVTDAVKIIDKYKAEGSDKE